MNILCWLLGHSEYNQVRNLGEKDEYFDRICDRCKRVKKIKSNPWYDPRIECEERRS